MYCISTLLSKSHDNGCIETKFGTFNTTFRCYQILLGYVDGVYTPPDLDLLTDEENFEDANFCEEREHLSYGTTQPRIFQMNLIQGSKNKIEDVQLLSCHQSFSDDSSYDEKVEKYSNQPIQYFNIIRK